MWFFSQTQQQLERPNDDSGFGSGYGAAAQKLRRRPRPGLMAYGKITEFELDAPTFIHAMIPTTRKQNCHRLLQRVETTRCALSQTLSRASSVRSRGRDISVAEDDYVARLEGQLNACDASESPRSPEAQSSWQRQRSASLMTTLHAPHRPEGRDSVRCRQSFRSTAPSPHVTTLTKEWVKKDEEKAAMALSKGSTEAHTEDSFLAIPTYCTFPSRVGQSSTNSCEARLHRGRLKSFAGPSASNRSSAAAVVEYNAQGSTAQPPRRQRLLAKPIQSSLLLKDVMTTPVQPTRSSNASLLGSARIRCDTLERLRHGFVHQCIVLQSELEEKLEWRNRCRSALLRRNRPVDGATAVSTHSPASATSTLRAAGVNALHPKMFDEVFGSAAGFSMRLQRRSKLPQFSSFALHSVWSQEAARQAVQQEKHRLVDLLESFVVTCSAAALTLAATEELRAETIRRVWHPEGGGGSHNTSFLHCEQFLKFLQGRYELHTSQLLGAAEAMCPTDILDALPSQAEASFARYAYEILPSRAERRL
ncbi:hypothetical protein NXY56_007542 [Leishmania guyanensis]|uniref:Uncharacterized protein n=1 Tax=Leishmania guyanensis TaxID=5670 RepID=A0A1E1J6U4_LEIGU|nr:hypothetical protein, conserved [Leishmania guyanensis]